MNQCGKYCGGCKDLNNVCYPFGTRVDNNYCSLNKTLMAQKLNGDSCKNSYECSSNLCIDNKCIEEGIFQKLINWFKDIFA